MKNFRVSIAAAVALACLAGPASAQDSAVMEEVQGEARIGFTGLGPELQLEPLTPEQEARLPLAREVVALMMPEGVMGTGMGSFLGGVFGATGEQYDTDPQNALQDALGYYFYDMDIADRKAELALDIIDPAWRERQQEEAAAAQEITRRMMATVEPIIREAMVELYAIHFTEPQLQDIGAFYATPTGEVFARESMRMANDPRLYARLFADESIWSGAIEEAIFDPPESSLPRPRMFAELSEQEQDRLIALTGESAEDLAYAMSYAYSDASDAADAALEAAMDAMEEAE